MAFLIIALMLAELPVPSVFAASGDGKDAAVIDALETVWSLKLRNVRAQSYFYDHVRLYPADFKNLDELARAYDLLHRYGFALRGAETVIANRNGFDAQGRVTNLGLADQSVKDLAYYLHIMRGLREKLDAVPRKDHRR
jgi:hypothetical protein